MNKTVALPLRLGVLAVGIALLLTLTNSQKIAFPSGAADDWPSYGHDPGGMRFSPLTQINKGNVGTLKAAWTFHTGDISDGTHDARRSGFETTPILVAGTLDPFIRAFDVENGKEFWKMQLPASGHATSMTYQLSPSGKQFVVIAADGHSKITEEPQSDALVAFTLP